MRTKRCGLKRRESDPVMVSVRVTTRAACSRKGAFTGAPFKTGTTMVTAR
jgi:hypothetical protein